MFGDGTTGILTPPRNGSGTGGDLAAILLAMDRLLTAGALYPMGHGRFDAAVAEFCAAVGDERAALFEIRGGKLLVQRKPAAESMRGHDRLLGLFDKLGLHRIRIDTDAPADALHALAARLLRQRREAEASGHLKQADFDDLPDQVQVIHRAFRKRWAAGIDPRYLTTIEKVIEDAETACGDTRSAKAVRGTLQRMFSVLMAAERDGGADSRCSPEDHFRVAEMLESGPSTMSGAIREIILRDGDLGCLEELFDDSHEALTSAAAHTAVEILVTALRGPDKAGGTPEAGVDDRDVTDESEYSVPLDTLRHALESVEAESESLTGVFAGDLREEIAIYVTILSLGAGPGVARQALAGLWSCAERVRSTGEREYVRETALSLLAGGDRELVDMVLPRLVIPFRERGSDTVADWWQSLAAAAPEHLELIWPHVVVELLRTEPETGLRGLSVLQSLATALDKEAVLKEASRFDRLTSFRAADFNGSLFYRPRPDLYRLYGVLLRTSLGATFGGWLQEGYARLNPDTPGGILARALGPYRPEHRSMYGTLLASGATAVDDNPAPAVLGSIRLAVESLEGDDRAEDWVAPAIDMIGTHSPASCRRLLDRIVGQRRLLVLRAWPKPARLAAARARAAASARGEGER